MAAPVCLDASAVLVCDLAQAIAPATSLRTLDALHLATFQIARGKLDGLELLTADERLRAAAGVG